MVPLGGVGGDALDDATPRGADVFQGLVPAVHVQVAEFLPGECSGLIHGPGRHDDVGVKIPLVLPSRLVN
jgi:hypothetical protein